jgi:hypothetical protein
MRRSSGAGQVVAAVAVGHAVWRSLMAVAEWRAWQSDQAAGSVNPNQQVEVKVLLPAYQVESKVESTLAHFERLEVPAGTRLEIIVVTTEREGGLDSPTPRSVAAAVADRHGGAVPVRHFHSARKPYSKAAQLNDVIAESESDAATTWFVVYDFDGRPTSRSVVDLVESSMSDPAMRIWQQPAFTILEPAGGASAIMRADSFEHLVRAFYNERRKWRRRTAIIDAGSRLGGSRTRAACYALRTPFSYCVGNGLAVRGDLLVELGGFPEPVDDLGIGFRACYRGERIGTLQEPVTQARYANVADYIRSRRFIYRGKSDITDRAGDAASKPFLRLVMTLKGGALSLYWPLRPLVVVGAAACAPGSLAARITKALAALTLGVLTEQVAGRAIAQGLVGSGIGVDRRVWRGGWAILAIQPWLDISAPWINAASFARQWFRP